MAATKRKFSGSIISSEKRHKKTFQIVKSNGATDGKIVNVDELEWEEVKMPDRLDDVEGFFGLEEVEGVDVFRQEGIVKFKSKQVGDGKKRRENGVVEKKEKKEKEESERIDEENKLNKLGKEKENENENEEQWEEWCGIAEIDEKPKLKGILKKTSKYDKVNGGRSAGEIEIRKKNKAKDGGKMESAHKKFEKLIPNAFSMLPEVDLENETPLPDWVRLGLSPETLRAIGHLKFTSPTPIQSASIPLIMNGHDLIGKASTGSGKTLAFAIPILERYIATTGSSLPFHQKEDKKKKDRNLIALIISPTRELAHQIGKHIDDISRYTDMRTITLTGGLSLQKQLRLLETGVDVIVSTPGRLWEVMSEGSGWLDVIRKVKILVLDEADRVLQEGHFKEVEQILDLMKKEGDDESEEEEEEEEESESEVTPTSEKKGNGVTPIRKLKPRSGKSKSRKQTKKRKSSHQTLVFSATFHKGLQQKLSGKPSKKSWRTSGDLMSNEESMEYLLKKLHFRETPPKYIDVNPVNSLAESIKEAIVECGAMEKDLYLYYLLLRYKSRTLVFVNSIYTVKRLTPFLNNLNLKAYPLHSRMIQKARLRSLERFSDPNSSSNEIGPRKGILIATDVAARGLDIKNVEMVLHYHLPRTADMYVHRSGRTARASQVGVSILLCSPDEVRPLGRLIGKVHAEGGGKGYDIKNFNIDRNVVGRLKTRVDLAKKIADSEQENQKFNKEDDWLKNAAEELGVDLDEEGISARKNKQRNKGKTQKQNGNEDDDYDYDYEEQVNRKKSAGKVPSKEDISRWKWELKEELNRKVNTGFSEKYITSGLVNLAEHMLKGEGHSDLLGEDVRGVIDEVK